MCDQFKGDICFNKFSFIPLCFFWYSTAFSRYTVFHILMALIKIFNALALCSWSCKSRSRSSPCFPKNTARASPIYKGCWYRWSCCRCSCRRYRYGRQVPNPYRRRGLPHGRCRQRCVPPLLRRRELRGRSRWCRLPMQVRRQRIACTFSFYSVYLLIIISRYLQKAHRVYCSVASPGFFRSLPILLFQPCRFPDRYS